MNQEITVKELVEQAIKTIEDIQKEDVDIAPGTITFGPDIFIKILQAHESELNNAIRSSQETNDELQNRIKYLALDFKTSSDNAVSGEEKYKESNSKYLDLNKKGNCIIKCKDCLDSLADFDKQSQEKDQYIENLKERLLQNHTMYCDVCKENENLKQQILYKQDFDIVKETQYWSKPNQKQSNYKYVLIDNSKYDKLESKEEN